MNLNKFFKISLLFVFLPFIFLSCGGPDGKFKLPGGDARKFPADPKERVKKNLEEGRGFKINDAFGGPKGGVFDFASSNELWRASLDTIDFMPLLSVNYSGGIIVTDWYSDNQSLSGESVKISIRFLTNEIRSDAIQVIIHKKKCVTFNECKISNIENITNQEIKFAILKQAAEIEKEDLVKTRKKNKDVKLPKNF